ncbi:lytic polysaccharide monooxygenase [Xylariaceae sp. FL0016]|nr:lytic polysaccharide monooxygenase [Xylariaceae sp. FL0016]
MNHASLRNRKCGVPGLMIAWHDALTLFIVSILIHYPTMVASQIPVVALAFLATGAQCHGHVREVIVDGIAYPGYDRWKPQDLPDTVSWPFTTEDEGPVPVEELNGPDIICHQGATNARASVPVVAGQAITIHRFNEIGGFEHPGPEMHYLAPCGDAGCARVDKNELPFFKIHQVGLTKGGMADSPTWVTQRWATTDAHKSVVAVDGGFVDTFTVVVPKDIKPGGYVLRHELWGLHRADKGQAEAYPQCININLTSPGSASPHGVPATTMYDANDEGIKINIWRNLQNYIIPGPAIYTAPG